MLVQISTDKANPFEIFGIVANYIVDIRVNHIGGQNVTACVHVTVQFKLLIKLCIIHRSIFIKVYTVGVIKMIGEFQVYFVKFSATGGNFSLSRVAL